jgi:hypothetical protein
MVSQFQLSCEKLSKPEINLGNIVLVASIRETISTRTAL